MVEPEGFKLNFMSTISKLPQPIPLIFGFEGTDGADALSRARSMGGLGVILFARNCVSREQVQQLLGELERDWPGDPPLCSIDHEGPRVHRMRSFVEEPPDARTLGASEDTEVTYETGRGMGKALRELGFHINFAPVLDLDEFPDHPALKQRCFHKDPLVVGQHGAALVRGLHEAGITACGKHFPGHGSAHLDSHVVLPESPRTLAELQTRDLLAYRDPVEVGLELIMTAHVRFSAISESPSTCNPTLLSSVLRNHMGYTGAVITDDLDMEGFRAMGPIRTSVQQAIMAGVDILLCCRDPELQEDALAALCDLHQSSSAGRERVEEAAKRAHKVYCSAHQRSREKRP